MPPFIIIFISMSLAVKVVGVKYYLWGTEWGKTLLIKTRLLKSVLHCVVAHDASELANYLLGFFFTYFKMYNSCTEESRVVPCYSDTCKHDILFRILRLYFNKRSRSNGDSRVLPCAPVQLHQTLQHNQNSAVTADIQYNLNSAVTADIQYNLNSAVTADIQYNLNSAVTADIQYNLNSPCSLRRCSIQP